MQLDVKEVASHLDVQEHEVYRWIKRKEIPCFRMNDHYRFNRAELLEWAASRKKRLHPHILPDSPISTATVSEALDNGGIYYDVEQQDSEIFLRRLMNLLPLPDQADRNFAMELIRQQPDLGLVDVGDGVKIPHILHPMVADVTAPTLVLCFSTAGKLPLNISENGGNTAVFFLVAPDVHTHQHLVSRLAFLLEEKNWRRLLQRQAAPPDLMAALKRAETELLS